MIIFVSATIVRPKDSIWAQISVEHPVNINVGIYASTMYVYQDARVQVSPGTTTVSEDSPLIFSTVQLYVPTMSSWSTDRLMVSTVW